MPVKWHPFFTKSPFLYMKHIIDIEAWERRDNYNFFRNFVSSWYSITTEIDCTEASAGCQSSGDALFSFTIFMPCSVRQTRWMNFVSVKTRNGQVVFHDRVDIISPIAVPGKTFYTVRIPYYEDFEPLSMPKPTP